MTKSFPRFALLFVLLAPCASADTWAPPSTEITLSADGRSRVTVTPRPLAGALPYFEDKVAGSEPAGQRPGEAQVSPIARVEQQAADGSWQRRWQMPLVNDVGPTEVLLADDATYLVTFDNWHSAGYGDDVVVIYDGDGDLVRKLSLEQILPAAYVNQLPRSVSSRWWSGKHRLVDGDRMVELQIVPPGESAHSAASHVPVRIRLADGALIPPTGQAWERALAKATTLESRRLAAWQELRRIRSRPLLPPKSNKTVAWRDYMFELRDRIAQPDESMGGMVLAAPDQEAGYHDVEDIKDWVAFYDGVESYDMKSVVFASPASDHVAQVLAEALRARRDEMTGAHIVFVGTPAQGDLVRSAAAAAGAKFTFVDRAVPTPAGEPLPALPPPLWAP